MLALTNRIYSNPNDAQKGSSIEAMSEGLPQVDWNFFVYGDDFLCTYELIP